MARLSDVLSALEIVAPRRLAFEWDRIGLQVGDLNAEISRAVVSLDRSLGAVEHTRSVGAQLLLSHHPLIFTPLATVDTRSHVGRTVFALMSHGINFVAAHTNWDAAKGGINDALIAKLGLPTGRPFGSAPKIAESKLVVFVPEAAVDKVSEAAFAAGAGIIGDYRGCSFRTEGVGTFTGSASTHPTVGEPEVPQSMEEFRVEFVMRSDQVSAVVRAIRSAHPYEEPAIDVYPLETKAELPGGRIVELAGPMTLADLSHLVSDRLETRTAAWGDPTRVIKRIGVVGGAADGEWMNAQREGATALLTGEVKQHIAVEGSESGCAILAAGHFATEHPGCVALRDRMADKLPEIDWDVFEPSAGMHGRPNWS